MKLFFTLFFSLLVVSSFGQRKVANDLDVISYPKIKAETTSILTLQAIQLGYESIIKGRMSTNFAIRYITNYHFRPEAILNQYRYGIRISAEPRLYTKNFFDFILQYHAIEVFAKYERASISQWVNNPEGLYQEYQQFGLNQYAFGLHYKLGDVIYSKNSPNYTVDYFVGAGIRFKFFNAKEIERETLEATTFYQSRTFFGEFVNPSFTCGLNLSFRFPSQILDNTDY